MHQANRYNVDYIIWKLDNLEYFGVDLHRKFWKRVREDLKVNFKFQD